MEPRRQLYLLKVWRSEDGQLRLELREKEVKVPSYFSDVQALFRYLEKSVPHLRRRSNAEES